ncbi:MAG: hypothetical protein HYY40_05440 [Bacteroidetes bacterium]|nr:hypothetical protein [Bacteroidota bacterium]
MVRIKSRSQYPDTILNHRRQIYFTIQHIPQIDKEVVVFGPNLSPSVQKELLKQNIKYFTNEKDLADYVIKQSENIVKLNFSVGLKLSNFETNLAKGLNIAWRTSVDGKVKILIDQTKGLKYVSRAFSKSTSGATVEIYRSGSLIAKYRLQ